MSRSTAQLPKLSEELWMVLLLIARYRAVTLQLLELLCRDAGRDALRMRLQALAKSKWVTSIALANGERCYALGAPAQRLFGLHQTRGFPFTGDGLLQHVGIATFCAIAQHKRLLRDEFATKYRGAYRRGMPTQNFCHDEQADAILRWAIVDHASEPRRFRGKVSKVISRCLGNSTLEPLMRSGTFRIVVITALPEKQTRIEEALVADSPWTASVEVIAFPSLLQFYL